MTFVADSVEPDLFRLGGGDGDRDFAGSVRETTVVLVVVSSVVDAGGGDGDRDLGDEPGEKTVDLEEPLDEVDPDRRPGDDVRDFGRDFGELPRDWDALLFFGLPSGPFSVTFAPFSRSFSTNLSASSLFMR
jgi:hypothetical protein